MKRERRIKREEDKHERRIKREVKADDNACETIKLAIDSDET